ncbi:MAG: PHP domain-containing protein [Dysosmobacter welbionis]
MTLEVDTHTHTILSGHAWSTLRENCCAARGRGMKGLCLTEHAPGIEGGAPSFIPHSQRMLPQEVEGIRVYQGIEVNILDHQNHLDIPERSI